MNATNHGLIVWDLIAVGHRAASNHHALLGPLSITLGLTRRSAGAACSPAILIRVARTSVLAAPTRRRRSRLPHRATLPKHAA